MPRLRPHVWKAMGLGPGAGLGGQRALAGPLPPPLSRAAPPWPGTPTRRPAPAASPRALTSASSGGSSDAHPLHLPGPPTTARPPAPVGANWWGSGPRLAKPVTPGSAMGHFPPEDGVLWPGSARTPLQPVGGRPPCRGEAHLAAGPWHHCHGSIARMTTATAVGRVLAELSMQPLSLS